jgi:hypothetical protein
MGLFREVRVGLLPIVLRRIEQGLRCRQDLVVGRIAEEFVLEVAMLRHPAANIFVEIFERDGHCCLPQGRYRKITVT